MHKQVLHKKKFVHLLFVQKKYALCTNKYLFHLYLCKMKNLLKSLGINVTELAYLLLVSEHTLHSWLRRGGSTPPIHTKYITSLEAYQAAKKEFIASTDPSFRPVWSDTAPDGTLMVLDMYRGILELDS